MSALPHRPVHHLWWMLLLCLAVHACVPSPQTGASDEAIRKHFQQLGYTVLELSIGEMHRNPADERVYMAPLTYVVSVRSITLAVDTRDGTGRRMTSTNATIKVQLPRGPERDWEVSRVDGVALP